MSTQANGRNGHAPEVAARRGSRGPSDPVEDLLERAEESSGGEPASSVLADRVFGPQRQLGKPLHGAEANASTWRPDIVLPASTWWAFAGLAAKHLIFVWPPVRRETRYWRARAEAIPARGLREAAEAAMDKRGNMEGAALFAVRAPKEHRAPAIQALVAYQAAYNYVDTLAERKEAGGAANTEQLHQALLMALHEEAQEPDYYKEYEGDDDDGGYLTDLVRTCRGALGKLPRYQLVAPRAREAAARIVDFQTLNLRASEGGHVALRAWAKDTAAVMRRIEADGGSGAGGAGASWWELAAGAGSSLEVHALIAAAANPVLDLCEARDVGRTYFPWGGALHSLLDSLVDRGEDRAAGYESLLGYYSSGAQAAVRLGHLARETLRAAENLEEGNEHRVILIAMCSYYLSATESDPQERDLVAGILKGIFGAELDIAIGMFRAKRWVHGHLGSRFR
jgi:tetraprenyl-beta-curcumene synthase